MNCYMPETTVSSKGLCMYKLILIAAYTSTIQWNWIKNCLVTVFLLVDIRDLVDIIEELEAQQFDCTKWSVLGLYLGLYQPTLNVIDADNRFCIQRLMACLSAWLEKKDAVENKGCPSWLTLVKALEELKEHKIASSIKAKYCN